MSGKMRGVGWMGLGGEGEDVRECDLGRGLKLPMREGGVEREALLALALEGRGGLFRPAPSGALRAWRARLEEMSPPSPSEEIQSPEGEPSEPKEEARELLPLQSSQEPEAKRARKARAPRVSPWVARFFLWGLGLEQASRVLGFRGDMLGKKLPTQEPWSVVLGEDGGLLFKARLGGVVGVLRGKRARYVLLGQDAPRTL